MTLEQNQKMDAGTEVRARIEESLSTRNAPRGTVAAKIEHLVKCEGEKLWAQLKKRPSLGVVIAGSAGLGLASLVGVGELAMGVLAAYAAFQVLREGVAPTTVAKEMLEDLKKFG